MSSINVIYLTSTSSVSAQLVRTGTAAHCLDVSSHTSLLSIQPHPSYNPATYFNYGNIHRPYLLSLPLAALRAFSFSFFIWVETKAHIQIWQSILRARLYKGQVHKWIPRRSNVAPTSLIKAYNQLAECGTKGS